MKVTIHVAGWNFLCMPVAAIYGYSAKLLPYKTAERLRIGVWALVPDHLDTSSGSILAPCVTLGRLLRLAVS